MLDLARVLGRLVWLRGWIEGWADGLLCACRRRVRRRVAGIERQRPWVPAFAGMTMVASAFAGMMTMELLHPRDDDAGGRGFARMMTRVAAFPG